MSIATSTQRWVNFWLEAIQRYPAAVSGRGVSATSTWITTVGTDRRRSLSRLAFPPPNAQFSISCPRPNPTSIRIRSHARCSSSASDVSSSFTTEPTTAPRCLSASSPTASLGRVSAQSGRNSQHFWRTNSTSAMRTGGSLQLGSSRSASLADRAISRPTMAADLLQARVRTRFRFWRRASSSAVLRAWSLLRFSFSRLRARRRASRRSLGGEAKTLRENVDWVSPFFWAV